MHLKTDKWYLRELGFTTDDKIDSLKPIKKRGAHSRGIRRSFDSYIDQSVAFVFCFLLSCVVCVNSRCYFYFPEPPPSGWEMGREGNSKCPRFPNFSYFLSPPPSTRFLAVYPQECLQRRKSQTFILNFSESISASKLYLDDVYQYVYHNRGIAARGFQYWASALSSIYGVDHTWRRTSAVLNYERFYCH